MIATPGRLEDMFRRKSEGLDLAGAVRSLEVLVLDEADRLLEMGFEARYKVTGIICHLVHVCQFACWQNVSRTTEQIMMKYLGNNHCMHIYK